MHLLRVQGFYFARLQYSPIQAFTARFVPSMQFTAHATKPRTGLYSGFPCDLPRSAAVYTSPIQAAIILPAPRWSTSQRRSTSSAYQIPAPRRTLYRSAQPSYYNNVYKTAPLLLIHAKQCNRSQTMPARRVLDASHARRLAIWHRVSGQGAPAGGGSPAAVARRAARNHWRLAPQLFSGFRPIANRGQQ